MSMQSNTVNIHNTSSATIKDDQVNDLMKSIQNKLSMLACDDSIEYFEASKLQSPKRQYLTATNEKKNRMRMNINDLQTSNRKQQKQSASKFGESRIVSKINQIENYYMDKIQQLSTKMSSLEFDLQTMAKENEQLKLQNTKLKQALNRKQKQQNHIIGQRIEQLRTQLIEKFSKQSQYHFEQHLKQLKMVNEQLLQQRGKRKYLQQEISLIKTQKNNLQQFYRDLLDNHRNLIKLDIRNTQKSAKQNKGSHHHSYQSQKNKKQSQRQQQQKQSNSVINKKTKKKQKISVVRKTEELTNEEMIPFLAKGIQQLKDKLKIK